MRQGKWNWLSMGVSALALAGAVWAASSKYSGVEAEVRHVHEEVDARVRKDVLEPQLDQIRKDLTELRTDIKELLRRGQKRILD